MRVCCLLFHASLDASGSMGCGFVVLPMLLEAVKVLTFAVQVEVGAVLVESGCHKDTSSVIPV